MKKIYSLILASSFALLSFSSKAGDTITVTVNNFSFTPNNITDAVVGDYIKFELAAGTHSVVNCPACVVNPPEIPVGAAAFNSGTLAMGTPYFYELTQQGDYHYKCGFHSGMVGHINATIASGINESVINGSAAIYPNPFKDKLTIKYNGVESVSLFNVIGETVKTFNFSTAGGKVDVDLESLPAGIYFYRTYKDGNVVETKKIVKTK